MKILIVIILKSKTACKKQTHKYQVITRQIEIKNLDESTPIFNTKKRM